MPIEIKELHIKVTVTPPQGASARQEQGAANAATQNGGKIDKDALVAECVDQVLQILQNKSER